MLHASRKQKNQASERKPHNGQVSSRYFKILVGIGLAIAIYVVYFFHLTAVGIMGTDEPRYAAVGRDMALSSDWVTPRLWGQAWFEKPPLLYWMTGAAFRLGLSNDLAPRLPVAILSTAFLIFYYWVLRREFGSRAALYSTLMLSTSAWWIAFSQVGVTDLPLSVFFSAAILLALPWVLQGDGRMLPCSSVCLALAVLAKSLVPLVLVLPLLWFARKHILDIFRPRVLFTFLFVVLPWYVACYARNGIPFLYTLFVQHQFGRAFSDELQHVQPFYFYARIFLATIFPWCFLLGLLFQRRFYQDPRTRFLLATVIFGFIFFSAATNKLPGYLLPLLPALIALLGIRLAQTKFIGQLMFPCTLSLVFIPAVAGMLPKAIATGIKSAYPVDQGFVIAAAFLIPLLIMIGIAQCFIGQKGPHALALVITVGLTVGAVLFLKIRSYPELNKAFSTRGSNSQCLAPNTTRAVRYGANYYAGTVVPDCVR